ncbi:MAG: YggT family protein [Pseudomonadota bacterium]
MVMVWYVIQQLLQLYTFVIIIGVVLSWLIAFNVVNRHNQVVDAIYRTCTALTEPVLAPIRRMLPSLGGIDISPIILLIGIGALQTGLGHYVFGPLINAGL